MASVLEEELSEREVYVKSLQDYQVTIQSDLVTLLQRLQWSPQHFFDQESPRVTCSYCPNHEMPVESLKKHEEICYLIRKKGYTIEELEKEAPSSRFFYENSKIITIKLEKDVINAILDEHRRHSGGFELTNATFGERDVPQTSAASKIDFSPSERLVLYESVVKLAKESQRMQVMPEDSLLTVDFEALIKKTAKSKESGEPFSEAEKWAAMRDYKRRRQSYRAKNVHITKKTYTEIIREVIHNQVDLLQEVIKTEENISENKTAQKHDLSSSSSSLLKSDKLDGERKGHKRNSGTNTYKNQTASNFRKRDWESPDRKKRDTNKSDSRTRDQKNPDDRRRDRDRNNSPDSRKRDCRSPESRNRRSRRESPDQQRRNRSSPYSRKKDRKSPDIRKRDKEDLEQRSTKVDFEESWKKYDRENPEGALSHNKSPDHKKRMVECEYIVNNEKKSLKENQELETVSSKVCQTTEANIVVENEQRSSHHSMNEGFGEFLLKRLSSSEDNNNNDSDDNGLSSHRHRQRHKKSKKHKKHKHRHEKYDK